MPAIGVDVGLFAEVFEREVMMNVALLKRQAPQSPPSNPAFDAEDNRPRLFAITGSFFTVALLVVLLRVYVRVKIIKTLGADDYVMIAAMLFSMGTMICKILRAGHGTGRHQHTIKPADLTAYRHITFFHSQLFVLGTNSVKISIALLLMRLATLNKYLMRRFLLGTIVFMVCFTIACLGTLIFNCSPISGAWDPAVRAKGHCYSMKVFRNIGLFNTIVNITTDVMYATIPIPLVWKLHVNKKTRISLILVLSLGYFACAAGIVKGVKQANFLKIKDGTFWEEISTWGYIQQNVGIIAACIPTLKPLFRTFLEYTRGMSSGQRSNSGMGGLGERTPQNNLSYGKAKKSRSGTTSIQLTNLSYNDDGKMVEHTEIDLENKYPHNGSTNASSNFDSPSPKSSEENILPNNINQRPISPIAGSPPSRNVMNAITMTTEVIVHSSVNTGSNPVGKPKGGAFDQEKR